MSSTMASTVELLLFAGTAAVFTWLGPSIPKSNTRESITYVDFYHPMRSGRRRRRRRQRLSTGGGGSIKRVSLADSVRMSRMSVTDIVSGRYSIQDVVYHKSMDLFFTLVMKLFDANIQKTKHFTAEQIPIPDKKAKTMVTTTTTRNTRTRSITTTTTSFSFLAFFNGQLKILDHDEFIPIPAKVWYGIKLLNLLPFDDRLTGYPTVEHGKQDLHQMFHKSIPFCPEGWWESPTSDVSMKRLFFSGMAMGLIQKNNNNNNNGPSQNGNHTNGSNNTNTDDEYFVVDLSYMDKYEVRDGYERLGCKAYFDSQGNITKIQDVKRKIQDSMDYLDNSESSSTHSEEVHQYTTETFYKGDDFWDYAKLKVRTAAFIATSVIHLVEMHYIWGAIPASALRMYLPPNHMVRRVLTAHFFKTLYTVVRSTISLFHESGLLYRGLGLSYQEGLARVVQDNFESYKFQTFPEQLEQNQMADCDFLVLNHDGMDSYKILTEYISDLFDAIYPNEESLQNDDGMKQVMDHLVANFKGSPKDYSLENVKLIWGEILFRVTVLHTVVGDATWCSMDPSIINLRIQEKELETMIAPKEAAYAVAAITATTTVPCPTLDQNWGRLFDHGDDDDIQKTKSSNCKKALSKLHSKYQELDQVITKRNKTREFNVVMFQSPNVCLSIAS